MSGECVDLKARELIHKTQLFAGEVAAVVWGDHERRDNGLRSQMRVLADKLGELEISQRNLVSKLRHYLDTERAETCHGLKALAEHEAEGRADLEEEANVEIAKIQAEANVRAAEVAAKVAGEAGAKTQHIVVAGVIATALVSNIDKIIMLFNAMKGAAK